MLKHKRNFIAVAAFAVLFSTVLSYQNCGKQGGGNAVLPSASLGSTPKSNLGNFVPPPEEVGLEPLPGDDLELNASTPVGTDHFRCSVSLSAAGERARRNSQLKAQLGGFSRRPHAVISDDIYANANINVDKGVDSFLRPWGISACRQVTLIKFRSLCHQATDAVVKPELLVPGADPTTIQDPTRIEGIISMNTYANQDNTLVGNYVFTADKKLGGARGFWAKLGKNTPPITCDAVGLATLMSLFSYDNVH